jgi:hypothetical protein
MFDTSRGAMHAGGEGYPLRPELVESFYHACVPALILQEKFSSHKWYPMQLRRNTRPDLDELRG